jgi:hypothetical protein
MPIMVEDVSCQPVTMQVRTVAQCSQFGICGRQSGNVTGFNRVIRFSPVRTNFPVRHMRYLLPT